MRYSGSQSTRQGLVVRRRAFNGTLLLGSVGLAIVVMFILGPMALEGLDVFTEQDGVAYQIHAVAGTVLNSVEGPPQTAAAEWIKAADHARSAAEIDGAVRGLGATGRRFRSDQQRTSICPLFSGQPPWPGGLWPTARREQFALLAGKDLTCPGATIWGQIPDDVPISYAERPPTTGIFHNTWYPTYGVAPEPVPATAWLHNLAHGAVVLLYHCPTGCPDVVAQAGQLQASLPPGRNPRAGGASLLVTAYDDMDYPIVVVAWGQLLPLDRFDRDQIEVFFAANVDRGPECEHLLCRD